MSKNTVHPIASKSATQLIYERTARKLGIDPVTRSGNARIENASKPAHKRPIVSSPFTAAFEGLKL